MISTTPAIPHRLLTCLSVWLLFVSSAVAQETVSESKPLLTGKPLQEALNERKSLSYAGSELGKTLRDLQANTGICILIDRRVDPTTTVNLTTPYVTSRQIIEAVATHVGMSSSFGDSYVMIGPKLSTQKLKTLSKINGKAMLQLRRKLAGDVYRKLSESRNRSWPKLSQPAALITKEADAIGIVLNNTDAVPHDVWGQAILPAMSFSDFATMILIQFDLTFEVTADGTMNVVSLPESVGLQKSYRVSANDKAIVATKIAEQFPNLEISWKGNTASVFATLEAHDSLDKLINGKPDSTADAAGLRTRLFTFKVPEGTPLVAIVEQFRRSGIPIRIEGATDEVATQALNQTVQFDFTETAGSEFFPRVFADINAKVIVEDAEVILQFSHADPP